ncbi:MAG: hypothetical protein M3253_02720 [Chloroflexota bacterium]|nr:hypothetical protein [Chloroflexota bacterium]
MRRTVTAVAISVFLLSMSAGAVLAAPPSNDDIASATAISSLPFNDAIDTTDATTAVGDPDCFGRGPTVWYVYTAAADQTLLADTFGSDYDTTLSAYTGSSGTLEQIACNDDAGDDLQSRIVVNAEAGTTYYFMVGAFGSGPGGDLVFNVDETDAQPAQIDVSVNPAGRFDSRTGSATIGGTVTCNEGDFAFIDVELSQRVGRFVVSGFGGAFVECEGTAQPWSAEVFGFSGQFKGGKAEASVFGESCGLIDCAFDFEQRSISLRR